MSDRINGILPTVYSRTSVDTLLGLECKTRVYTSRGDAARGVATLMSDNGEYVMPAYILDGGNFVQGVAVSEDAADATLILARRCDHLIQSQLAERIDYWERGRSGHIYCLNEKSCGAVVYCGDGDARRYLLIRMNAGHCGLPKGHIEKFETEQDAAIREIREETGVAVRLIDGFREVVSYQVSTKTHKESVYFIGCFDGGDVVIQESEIRSYSLLPCLEAREVITHGNDRAVFENAVKWLAEHGI